MGRLVQINDHLSLAPGRLARREWVECGKPLLINRHVALQISSVIDPSTGEFTLEANVSAPSLDDRIEYDFADIGPNVLDLSGWTRYLVAVAAVEFGPWPNRPDRVLLEFHDVRRASTAM